MKHILQILVPALAFLFASSASALTFEVGAKFSAISNNISLTDEGKEKYQVKEGLDEDASVATSASSSWGAHFGLIGDESYFWDTNIGWTYSAWVEPGSETNRQKNANGDFVDVDTSIQGWYLYALPLLYYRFGDKVGENIKNYKITIGLGYGASYIDLKGDAKLTNIKDEPPLDVKAVGWNISSGWILKFEYNRWFFAMSNNTPQLQTTDFFYRVHNTAFSAGYQFSFDEKPLVDSAVKKVKKTVQDVVPGDEGATTDTN